MFDILRKYGKYLGGIDYEKIERLIADEDERLRIIESRLLDELSESERCKDTNFHKNSNDNILELERRRLRTKIEILKEREKRLHEMLIELKMSPGVTLYEINKLVREIKRVRREIRRVKKLLKYIEDSYRQS